MVLIYQYRVFMLVPSRVCLQCYRFVSTFFGRSIKLWCGSFANGESSRKIAQDKRFLWQIRQLFVFRQVEVRFRHPNIYIQYFRLIFSKMSTPSPIRYLRPMVKLSHSHRNKWICAEIPSCHFNVPEALMKQLFGIFQHNEIRMVANCIFCWWMLHVDNLPNICYRCIG